MGMPLTDSFSGFDGSLAYAEWYLENAERYLRPETTFENEHEIHRVHYEPIGVAAVILPWNFPFSNFVWGTLQSLLAGNTVVLKDSEECPLCGRLIEEVMSRHLPKGVFNEVYGDGETGRQLVDSDINMIAFTGSTKTGTSLYEAAGKKFIKAVMELGGSAPGIVFDDADLGAALPCIGECRLLNAGQSCDALKRLIVHEDRFDELVGKLSSVFASKRIGVAEEKATELGPLVSKKQLEILIAQVKDATDKGAQVVTGGASLEKQLGGAFFQPTILTNVSPDMRVWKEEVFGPVLPVVRFKTEEEAIALANDTAYGLGAYVFTRDQKRAARVAESIETGMVSVNGANYVMPFNPFGGYKHSGFGRQHGKYGFAEVSQIKVVAIKK